MNQIDRIFKIQDKNMLLKRGKTQLIRNLWVTKILGGRETVGIIKAIEFHPKPKHLLLKPPPPCPHIILIYKKIPILYSYY